MSKHARDIRLGRCDPPQDAKIFAKIVRLAEWARTGWSRGGSHGWLRGALEALQANPGRAQAWTVLGCTGAGILLFAVGHYKRLTGEKSMTVAPGFYPTRFTGTEKEREVLQVTMHETRNMRSWSLG